MCNCDDVIFLQPNEFDMRKHKSETCVSNMTQKYLNDIIRLFETYNCFASNYKYVPGNKHYVENKNIKPQIIKSTSNDNNKLIIQLLNKLTETNKKKIVTILLSNISIDTIDVFVDKMFEYTTISEMYAKLITEMTEKMYEDNMSHNIKTCITQKILKFLESFMRLCKEFEPLPLNVNPNLEDDDYDFFCKCVKQKKEQQHKMITVIHLCESAVIQQNIKFLPLIDVFTQILDNLQERIQMFFEHSKCLDHINMLLQFVTKIFKISKLKNSSRCVEHLKFVINFTKEELNLFDNKTKFMFQDLIDTYQ